MQIIFPILRSHLVLKLLAIARQYKVTVENQSLMKRSFRAIRSYYIFVEIYIVENFCSHVQQLLPSQ